MAKLSPEQQKALDELVALRDAPDDEPPNRSRSDNINVTIDLSDEAAVERAIGFGLLTRADVNGDDDGKDGDDSKDDDDGKDDAPRRRLDRRYS